MQPPATAEDVLRSLREIGTSILHGMTSPYDLINLTHLIKEMGFMNAVGAPSLDRSDSTDRPTGRRTEPPPIGQAGDRRGSNAFRDSVLSPERRSPISG